MGCYPHSISATKTGRRAIQSIACINAIGTATPDHDIHQAFVDWARDRITDSRAQRLFDRMVTRSGIARRWSVLPQTDAGGSPVADGGFYSGEWPGTAQRMAQYGQSAPALAISAVQALGEQTDLAGISHLVVASCTGFVAPGVDQIVAERLGLAPSVERLLVGYMGCYAAVAALRSARHIVRSDPQARVLVICVELSTLHLQDSRAVEPLLAMLQFGDGAAAAIVSADPVGLAIDKPFAATLPDSKELIQWHIGDHGFAMHLSGEVPGAITAALHPRTNGTTLLPAAPDTIDSWAVHAGGRSILDAVEQALSLSKTALVHSREVLQSCGNMSSATLMFVLERIMQSDASPRNGMALAFGPGVAVEGFLYAQARP
ncbi:MAG: type III polyketide synthase [Sphingobium sp.]